MHAGSGQGLNSTLEAVRCGLQFIAPCFDQRLSQPEETLLRRGIGKFILGMSDQRTRAFEVTSAGVRERLRRVECTEVTCIRGEGL